MQLLIQNLVIYQPDHLHISTIHINLLWAFKIHRQFEFLFVWLKKTDFTHWCIPNTYYAVPFAISTWNLEAQALASSYLLLCFVDENISDADYHRFALVALSFEFTSRGVYGVMFLDNHFFFAMSRVHSLAFLCANGFEMIERNPVSQWFLTKVNNVLEDHHEDTAKHSRELIFQEWYISLSNVLIMGLIFHKFLSSVVTSPGPFQHCILQLMMTGPYKVKQIPNTATMLLYIMLFLIRS